MSSVGYATLSVIPSTAGFGTALSKGVAPQMAVAGRTSGLAFSKAMLLGMAGIAAGAIAAVVGLGKVGQTFDKMFDTIRVGTGATGKTLDALNQSAKNVGKGSAASFSDIGTAIADLNTRTGQTGPGLEALTKRMLLMTKLTGGDLKTNIAGVTRVFGDWSISTGDQSKTMDYLFKVSQSTGIGIDGLSQKVVQFGAPLRQLGFSFEESAALLGKWEKEGVNTEAVLAGMKIGLGQLSKAGKEPVQALKDVQAAIKGAGSSGEANAIAIKTFGQRAGPDMAAAIREGRFSIAELMGTLKGSKETILTAADATSSFSGKWQKFKNNVLIAIEPMATRVFTALGDGMQLMNDVGLPVLQKFGGEFSAKVMPILTTFGAFLTGTVIPGVRALIAAFKAGGSDITSAGFAGIMERIGLAARAIADFIRNQAIPAIKDFATAVAIPALFMLAAYLTGTLVPAIDSFAKSLNDHRTAILGAAGAITMVFIPALLQLAVTATVSGAETIAIWAMLQASSIASTAASVVGFVVMAAKWVWTGHVAMVNAIKIAAAWVIAAGPIAWIIAAVIGLGILIWKNMDNIKGWIGTAWTWIKDVTTTVWTAISGFFTGLWASITGGISSAWASVVTFVSGVWSAITGFVSRVASIALTLLNWWTYPYRIGIAVVIGLVLLLAKGVMVVVNLMVGAVVGAWNVMWAMVAPIVTGIKDFVVGAWTAVSGVVIAVVQRMVAFVVAYYTTIWNVSVAIFGAVKGFLTGVWNGIFAVVSGVVARIWGAISRDFNRVAAVVGSVMGTVKGVISSAWDTIWGKISGVTGRISGAVSGAFNGIKDAIGGAIGSAVTAASSLASKVIDAIKGGLGKVASIGGDIVQGLINGITGAGGKLWTAITNFIRENVPEPVRKVLGVNSPSKVFAELGRNTVEGFIVGVDGKAGALDAQMRSLVQVPRVGSLDFATPAQRAAAVGGVAGDGGNADLLAEVQGLRADIRALPKTYQMGQRQYVGAR